MQTAIEVLNISLQRRLNEAEEYEKESQRYLKLAAEYRGYAAVSRQQAADLEVALVALTPQSPQSQAA